MFAPRGGVCVLISVAATWRAARARVKVATKTFHVAAVRLVYSIKSFMVFRSAVITWQLDGHVVSACIPDLFISREDEFVAAEFNSHWVRVLVPFMSGPVLNLTVDVLENGHCTVDAAILHSKGSVHRHAGMLPSPKRLRADVNLEGLVIVLRQDEFAVTLCMVVVPVKGVKVGVATETASHPLLFLIHCSTVIWR
jgi:hypothetical protein